MSSASTAGDEAFQQSTKLLQTMQKAIGPLSRRKQVCSYFCVCSNVNQCLSNTELCLSMEDLRKDKREAKAAAKKMAPILLPANAATNNRLHRNKLAIAPVNIQEHFRLVSPNLRGSTKHSAIDLEKKKKNMMPPPIIPRNAQVASKPSATETPEMQKRTRKRLAKDLYKNRDCMDERDIALHREVQTRLTSKNEAYLRKLDDFEAPDSQEALEYLKFITTTPDTAPSGERKN
jgi:hypothetical protein